MRNISDTIARLAALQKMHAPNEGRSGRLSPLSGFGSNPGALKANFYVPDRLQSGAPLVVVLHGCTQTAAAYDHHSGWSQLADRAGFALLYPEQQRANNANLCFNWFVPADTTRNSGEALSIRQMTETMIATHDLDRGRVFVTGLSAGGAMAAVMLATYPEVFAGGAIIAGLPYRSASTVPEAFDRMRGHGGPSKTELQGLVRQASDHQGPWPKLSIWHGSADQTVASTNAKSIAGQWLGVHGLGENPTGSEVVDNHTRLAWGDANGNALIESYSVAGMGHGTPLKTKGDDGLGVAGPFMLEAGISSTERIGQFWGIADIDGRTAAIARRKGQGARTLKPSKSLASAPTAEASEDRAANARPLRPNANTNGVGKIIEEALRKAGLMR